MRRSAKGTLEIYDADCNVVGTPKPLKELDAATANAVQVELMAQLLKSKNVAIPLL